MLLCSYLDLWGTDKEYPEYYVQLGSAYLRNSSLELRPKKDDQDGPGTSYVQRYDQSS